MENNELNNVKINPVTLKEILSVMEMSVEPVENGRFKVFDKFSGRYFENYNLEENEPENTFSDATEIFERLDIYINDYFINSMKEQLKEAGIDTTEANTLKDFCNIYKTELEKGNNSLYRDELELAMGIVNPETVIMPTNELKQVKGLEPQENNELKQVSLDPEEVAKNYLLNKLNKAGIEVIQDRDIFEEILKQGKILQKMSINIDHLKLLKQQIDELTKENQDLIITNKTLVRERNFIDFHTSLMACKNFINDLPDKTLPNLQLALNSENKPDETSDLIIKIQNDKLILVNSEDELIYDFDEHNIKNQTVFDKFKDFINDNKDDCITVLVDTIEEHLGKELSEQRKLFNSLIEENAILKGEPLNQLTNQELTEIKEVLKSQEYVEIEGIYVHKDKKIAVSTSDYLKEIQNAKVLLDACPSDSKLYILPEKFAFKQKNEQGQNETYSTPDFLLNDDFVESKVTEKKLGQRYGESVEQSNNVMIRIKDDISVYNGVSRIQRKIDRIQKENGTEVKDGNVFLYFEQKAQLIPLEIKGGKIYILPLEPKLADFSVVPPADTNINQSKDLSSGNQENSEKKPEIQAFKLSNGTTYGFTDRAKVYLNPDIFTSETAAHEYTHVWDKYIRETNPELWEKGKDIFKKTYLWGEVKNDAAYKEIANDEDLILSECHAKICGKIAQEVLTRIASENGGEIKDEVINWDKEVEKYIEAEFGIKAPELTNDMSHLKEAIEYEELKSFLSAPLKDIINERHLHLENKEEVEQNNSINNFVKEPEKEQKEPLQENPDVEKGSIDNLNENLTKDLPEKEKIIEEYNTVTLVEGETVLPKFSVITQNGLVTFEGAVLEKRNGNEKSWTVRDSKGESITIQDSTLHEIIENTKNNGKILEKIDKNENSKKNFEHLVKSQYKDFYELRPNTANNFYHNFEAYCRREANSPCDAFKVAQELIKKLSPGEKNKVEKLLKKQAQKKDMGIKAMLAERYHKAVSIVPLNNEKVREIIDKEAVSYPYKDLKFRNGESLSSDPELFKNGKDYNLKIGDTISLNLKEKGFSGKGEETVHYDSLKVISACKESNSLTVMQGKDSFFELSLDSVLTVHKRQAQKEIAKENKAQTKTLSVKNYIGR